ncbi:hypothetical protein [Orf virus]|uniref:Uncharacterized protein n=1 Tax=Orf virus (strain NZ2) TaxID=10259 RepID=Q2F8F9_ORFN2|nr:hypothetical protein [Orf virus]
MIRIGGGMEVEVDENATRAARGAMLLSTSFMESMVDIVRQEELARQFCYKNGMTPCVSVRMTGRIDASNIGEDTWELARSHDIRHVVLFKASVVDWHVDELFVGLGEKLGGLDALYFVADGFYVDASPVRFTQRSMETMLRCVLRDVMEDVGGGVMHPREPSAASQCLMDRYMVPFGCLLAMQAHFARRSRRAPTPLPRRASPRPGARRSPLHGYADSAMYRQALADARRANNQLRRRRARDDVLSLCRNLDNMRVDD